MCECSFCSDILDIGDVFDIISLIVQWILGKEYCFKKMKKSPKRSSYVLYFRIFCFVVGIGFDVLLLYLNFPRVSMINGDYESVTADF